MKGNSGLPFLWQPSLLDNDQLCSGARQASVLVPVRAMREDVLWQRVGIIYPGFYSRGFCFAFGRRKTEKR